MEEREKQHRLFFALWPDDEVREEIKKKVLSQLNKNPAKKVPQHNWHITLAFLGNVPQQTKHCALEKAGLAHAEPFELQLDRVGFFKRARVIWLGSDSCPAPLTNLFDQLNTLLSACGYQTDYKTFIPHMTLLRKAYKSVIIDEFIPINWSINNFVLVESVTTQQGAHYEVIRRWPLGG